MKLKFQNGVYVLGTSTTANAVVQSPDVTFPVATLSVLANDNDRVRFAPFFSEDEGFLYQANAADHTVYLIHYKKADAASYTFRLVPAAVVKDPLNTGYFVFPSKRGTEYIAISRAAHNTLPHRKPDFLQFVEKYSPVPELAFDRVFAQHSINLRFSDVKQYGGAPARDAHVPPFHTQFVPLADHIVLAMGMPRASLILLSVQVLSVLLAIMSIFFAVRNVKKLFKDVKSYAYKFFDNGKSSKASSQATDEQSDFSPHSVK